MRTTLALLLLTAIGLGQGKVDEAKAIREFQRSFTSTRKQPKTLTDRMAAVKLLRGFDSRRVAQALAKAFQDVEEEVATEDALRLQLTAEFSEIIKGQEYEERRVIPAPKVARHEELKKLLASQRAKLDNLRQLQGELATLIRELTEYESLSWLVRNVLTNKRFCVLLKITVCSSAGGMNAALVEDMKKALQRAKQPYDIAALLDGIGHIGKEAKALGPQILKLLKHKTPMVGERAALALGRIRFFEAVPALIDLLEKADGPVQKRVGHALADLTGQKHGTSVASWRGWYEKEGKELIAAGKLDPGDGGSEMFDTRPAPQEAGRYYMGIPQDGEAIVYVIDSSGSMKKPVKWGKPGRHGGGITVARSKDDKDPGRWANTRLGACQQELILALQKLPRTKTFNIVWYSDIPHKWKDTMQKALPSKIKEAQDWVRKLQPNSMTNIHDAMQTAFSFARGRGIKDKAYSKGKIGLDTIFLLSDGSPTKPDGTLDDHNKILVAVQQWNPLKRVTVHTIGIGDGLNVQFMAALAEQNGGEFKHYLDTGELKK